MKLGTPDLRRHEFGDPAVTYERDEAGTCHGCTYEYSITLYGKDLLGCEKGHKHGRKCPQFRVRMAVARTDGDG